MTNWAPDAQAVGVVPPDIGGITPTVPGAIIGIPSFPTTPVLDNFNRSNRTLTGDGIWNGHIWSSLGVNAGTDLQIVSNQVEGTIAANAVNSACTKTSYSRAQTAIEMYMTVTAPLITFDLMWCLSNVGTTRPLGYTLEIRGPNGSCFVYMIDSAGNFNQIGSSFTAPAYAAGSKWGVRHDAAGNITVYLQQPGGVWVSMFTGTDTTYSGGRLGINIWDDAGTLLIDDFGGGLQVLDSRFGFPASTVLDNFNRSNRVLNGDGIWDTPIPFGDSATQSIANNVSSGTGGLFGGVCTKQQYSRATLPIEVFATVSGGNVGIAMEITTPATTNGYEIFVNSGSLDLYRLDAGAYTHIGNWPCTTTFPMQAGFRHDPDGTITLLTNLGSGWLQIVQVTDNTYNFGSLGFECDVFTVDNFGGGNPTPWIPDSEAVLVATPDSGQAVASTPGELSTTLFKPPEIGSASLRGM